MFFSFCPLRCCRTAAALHLAAARLVACCWTINSHLCGSFCPWRIQVLCTVCLAPLMGWQRGSSVWLVVRLLGSCTRLPHLPLPTYDPCIELIEFCIMSDHQQQQEQLEQQQQWERPFCAHILGFSISFLRFAHHLKCINFWARGRCKYLRELREIFANKSLSWASVKVWQRWID